MSAPLTAEMRLIADTARTVLHQHYGKGGKEAMRTLASRTLWVIGETVSDYCGRAEAVEMLAQIADTINESAETSPGLEPEVAAGFILPAGSMLIRIPTNDAEVDQLLKIIYGMRGQWGQASG